MSNRYEAERYYPFHRFVLAGLLALGAACTFVWEQATAEVTFIDAKPLTEVVTTAVQDCGGDLSRVPTIAWGADLTTSYANGNATTTQAGSIFADEGLDVTLYRQDDFVRQLEDFLACKTPFLRATNGMLHMAVELLAQDPRTAPVVAHQHSFSAGGDALVVSEEIKKPEDLKGKTIVLQTYGPHVDYMMRILKDASLTVNDVTIKWVKDLIQVDERSSSPAMAFAEGKADAAFVITPDALMLTSGGTVGTGSEGSVKGAHLLLSTKSLDTVITDLYVVRKDFFEANKAQVQAFAHGLLRAEEAVSALMKSQGDGYEDMLAAGASLILDNPSDTATMAEMYTLDLTMAGYRGNVEFFGDPKNPRRFEVLVNEAQDAFIQLGLLTKRVPVAHAMWDYAVLAEGLNNTADVEVQKFDAAAVAKVVERRAQQGATEGELFSFEIYFAPNQNTFPAEQYQAAFDKAIDLASTYGGALLVVNGHSDPLGYLKQKKEGAQPIVLNKARQSARNLSMARANAVKDSLIAYAATKGLTLDASQFGVSGLGVNQPNTPNCTRDGTGDIHLDCAPATEAEWNATRRVVFEIIQVEAEASVFSPL